jgi:hypothetical protein
MRIGKAFAAIALGVALLCMGSVASAHPPNDDFINPQDPGARLTLMPFIGPGFRANYDHRFKIEKDMSELRTQLMGTVAIPFSEVSANVDVRFFLMLFGASVGYHDEWRVHQFNPDPKSGRDRAGQPAVFSGTDPMTGTPLPDATATYNDLTNHSRAVKDQNADVKVGRWAWAEGRWGFVWPAYNFLGVSNLAFRYDGRPDVTYDWENGTVMNGGLNVRWEGYAFFRSRNIGFIGPALRAMYVPRNRLEDGPRGAGAPGVGPTELPVGSACRTDVAVTGIDSSLCREKYEFEFHYGVIAGLRPNWTVAPDTFLIRVYTAYGLNNKLFGTQVFRQPIQILVAYMVDIDL